LTYYDTITILFVFFFSDDCCGVIKRFSIKNHHCYG
jgi:hypothetical protein